MTHALSAMLLAFTLSQASDGKPQIQIAPGGKADVIPAPQPAPVQPVTSVTISGERFELLTLTGYSGLVTFDVTTATGTAPPVVLFEKQPGTESTGWRMGAAKPDRYPIGKTPTIEVYAVGDGAATLVAWGVESGRAVKLATFGIVANRGPQPPPDVDPKPPEPKPPEPKPPVVTSFRVIWVYESGDTIPANQTAVMDAKAVRDYLNSKTTRDGPWLGWRQFDPQTRAENEVPAIKALWQAVQPKLTTIPCMVIEVNGKADILPFPKTPAEALATLKSYGGQ